MTMVEKRAESIRKEIEKLSKSLTTHKARLEKKIVKAEKVNANWTREEFFQNKDTMTQDQWSAYFDKSLEEDEVAEIEKKLANAEKRLANILPEVEAKTEQNAEADRVSDMESKFYHISRKSKEEQEAEYEAWERQFKAECLKDGIKIEEINGWAISGTTKSGKTFGVYGNSGYTERSLHCYTLYIDKQMVFTSGDFSTAYKLLKK